MHPGHGFPKGPGTGSDVHLTGVILHARDNSSKEKIRREKHRGALQNVSVLMCLCLGELHCVVPTAEAGQILEELTISCKDSLCEAQENLKDRRHF